ncbi:hypothetical protein PRZ48_012128 [Zasmidium cellare]|uniref:Chitinase n=1 Tax=Zasmidium cellare TaxID=395010 RepID=A0ABR0E402_ZASCE|nr:hypothetical protein PRZ48_012128 [Zasmidium cellare]
MKSSIYSLLVAALPSALAFSSATRPFTAPIATPPPTSAVPTHAEPASSQIPANTHGPKAPRNVAFVAYAYDDQWDGTNTSKPAIDVDALYQDQTGVDTLVINPCDVNENNPAVPQCHGWDFINSTYWEQIWPSYQSVQANGILLIASYGGYGSNTFQLLNQSWDTYYPPNVNMLKTYKFDGIDFDIEPSNDDYVPPLSLALKLVNSIRSDMGQEFIITFTPVSSDLWETGSTDYSGFSSWQLDQEATTTGADGTYVISNGNWDPSRVVLLAPGTSTVGGGWVNLTTLEAVAKNLTDKYGQGKFGGVGGYEYARAGEADDVTNWQWFKDVSQAQGIATS